jgi:hypothetical protein
VAVVVRVMDILAALAVQVVWVVAALVEYHTVQLLTVLQAQQIAAAVAVLAVDHPALAVQALSFFATPAQFNISLVAQ